MDSFDELERMALNATPGASTNADLSKDNAIPEDWTNGHPSEGDIARWQQLFKYPRSQAWDLIERHRNDISRQRIPDELWQMVRENKEAAGYDCEAYEHELAIAGISKAKPDVGQEKTVTNSPSQAHAIYLLKLEGPLGTPEKVREATSSAELPEVIQGSGDGGDAAFCRVNGNEKIAIALWLGRQKSSFNPTFVRLPGKAKLSADSAYPTLGLELTLPQNRPVADDIVFRPMQNEFPVWYFFYGTLAEPVILTSQLSLSEDDDPVLKPATILGGELKTWGGKYRALVDGTAHSQVEGSAYLVPCREHEDALRIYETEKYEVVRCEIVMGEERVMGCTFRFVGILDALSSNGVRATGTCVISGSEL